MPLYMVEKKLNGVLLLDIRGRLTLGQETADLRAKLSALLDAGNLRIILKLEGVTYIDSAGLSTLIGSYISARKRGGDLKLTHLTARVRDLMQITRLSTVFDTYNTVEAARKSFEAP
jgi:anti-sigma B factor antagonist